MSTGSYWQVYVGCPFYRSDDGKQKIVCEGLGADSTLTNRFRTKRDFEKQMNVFCCKDYAKCALNQILMAKYED